MQLSEAELLAFEELLDKPDNSLWDLIAGRQAVVQQPELMLLQKIRLV
jgi:succinate dehydrogenase flavin-adding protein (antitoxin of CptAB toxin-antitoxin module)